MSITKRIAAAALSASLLLSGISANAAPWDNAPIPGADIRVVPASEAAFYPMAVSEEELTYSDEGAVCTMAYTNYANEETIFRYIVDEIGMNEAIACGILANALAESKFDPLATGDNGTSHGILQWHKERWDLLVTTCQGWGLDPNSLEGQLRYLKYEILSGDRNANYNWKTLDEKIFHQPNTAEGAYWAGYYWCYYYERPAAKETSSGKRGTTARDKFWAEYAPTYTFPDVKPGAWYYDAVEYVNSKGVMTGMSDGTFAPTRNTLRSEFAMVLFNMEKQPSYTSVNYQFPDVKPDAWYYDAVMWAASQGIVHGYDNGNFGPADYMNREQLAVMMQNYCNFIGFDTTAEADLSRFYDENCISEYAKPALSWAVASGLISGKTNSHGYYLDPLTKATRAEVASVLQRLIQKTKRI